MMLGSAAEFRTITFQIKPKEPKPTILDTTQDKQQSEVEQIKTHSCETIAKSIHSLIKVDSFETSSQYHTLTHTLKLLKALYFISQNTKLFIKSGLQILF